MTAAKWRTDRSGDRYSIRLTTHTGLALFGRSRGWLVQGSFDDCVVAYREAQAHNLRRGWWSVPSLLGRNWWVLIANRRAMGSLRSLEET